MNSNLTLFFALILTFSVSCNNKKTVSISGAFALYPLGVKWAQEYEKTHPNIRIDISAGGTGKGISDVLSGNAEIGMVSREVSEEELQKGAWKLAVTKDAVIPTINVNNPYLQTILSKGVSKEHFMGIWSTGTVKTWGQLTGDSNITKGIQVFTRSDAAGAPEIWAKYLGKKQEDLLGVGIFGDPGLAEAVKKDVNSVGYNNLAFIYNLETKKPFDGIQAMPIDINGNGTLDSTENFYENMDAVIEAINKGVYPSPPARDLYFLTQGKPTNPEVREFLEWVLTEGQQYVASSGYVQLPESKITEELNKLK
jgi:phosphate transport system substrate-binding protein